ncbi:HAMP domain-containing histidine kinase [Sphingomonas sp. PAMC26645]|uniref:HAMP domain-containing sensor histidine kinase n=1 Tax=Sphingomonas sp. PAMC26645 TaxID=2565555 RepID=UPI00109DE234|nr:HAMP domain-containing sensor histidine kinase [Sphingomonas sp. PAMC26645]QCB41155.1 HAMP domain-containing histidine kinase [Sphingomonas sp. PAMC26645]
MAETARTARQITLFFIGGFTLVTLALGVGADLVGKRILTEQLDEEIAFEMRSLLTVAGKGGAPAMHRALQRRDDRGVNNFGYLLIGSDGRRLGGELATTPPRNGWDNIRFRDLEGGQHAARAQTTTLSDGARLTVATELAPAEELRSTLLSLFLAGFCIMLAVGLTGGALFGRMIRARLGSVNRAAMSVTEGDLGQRIAVSDRQDEFDQLATTLNNMLDRNAALIENLRHVSSDIAHDLRTPIMRLRLRFEQALALAEDDSEQARQMDRSIADIDAILSLFAALLRIAEIESGALHAYFHRVELSQTVAMLAESYVLVAQDSGRSLACHIDDGIALTGDTELLAQIVVNLLENALRHTPNGSIIKLELTQADNTAILTIGDNGIGIPDCDRARAVQRFSKLARGPASGHGLGLNLVAAIAAAHGGSMKLLDNHPGLIVSIALPIFDNPQHTIAPKRDPSS